MPPMFTSRHHANVGIPPNPENGFYWLPRTFNPLQLGFVDLGTGGAVSDPWHHGRVKIPTLRNVALTAPYMHNGVFGDLQTVVEFYNTRDVSGMPWDAPEVDHANIIRMFNLGNLGLTDQEIQDIVAFLHTLTDGYQP
jgi:cytochrome c peroxidase